MNKPALNHTTNKALNGYFQKPARKRQDEDKQGRYKRLCRVLGIEYARS